MRTEKSRRREMDAIAFISTSFGFGPVSKAVTIAQELKSRAPACVAHYFGAGIDYDYAIKSGTFDRVVRANADRHDELAGLITQLATYGAVVSVMNFDILPLWGRARCPLYLVDSLAWMWSELPAGIENVETYFAQAFLMPRRRAEEWSERAPMLLVAPIETASLIGQALPRIRQNRLIVNYSGAANPFAAPGLYEKYGLVLTSAILEEAKSRYESIVICCNERLSRYLRNHFAASSAEINHFSHDDFVRMLATSQMALTAPGITTTLEALATRTPVKFLLPQNDSQALVSEHYKYLLGEDSCMPFSRFTGAEFSVPRHISKEEAVGLALKELEMILENNREQLQSVVRELLNTPISHGLETLKRAASQWDEPGQRAIVTRILSFQQNFR